MIPQAPPKGKHVRYPMTIVSMAREMYGDGSSWTPQQIRDYLADRFSLPTLHRTTVRYWVEPGFVGSHAVYRRRSRPGPRLMSAEERWARLVALRDGGVSYRFLAVIAKVDYGVMIDPDVIRYAFNTGNHARVLKKLAG